MSQAKTTDTGKFLSFFDPNQIPIFIVFKHVVRIRGVCEFLTL